MKTAVVIGAGHNGLVAAFYLARAGFRTIVLEARHEVGGGAVTGEIHPGFRCPTLTHEVLLHRQIVAEMDLAGHGLELLRPAAETCVLSDSRPLVFYDDVQRTEESIREFHAADADAYAEFRMDISQTASVLRSTFEYTPPSIRDPGPTDLWNLLKTARAFRALGKRAGHQLLRWGPMPAADFADEWFEHGLVQAGIVAQALTGTMLGPRSAGSSLILLLREAHRQLAVGASAHVRGGPGAATQALASAARGAGADIRTAAPVEQIIVRNEIVSGVISGGQAIDADVVLSSADPKTTFLQLMDASDLMPDFGAKIRHYRAAGTLGKVNLALSSLPAFGCSEEALTGRIQIGPNLYYLERAFDHVKYGEMSAEPWLQITIPSLLDRDLAPNGGHVASVYVHYTPYVLRNGDWGTANAVLLDTTLDVLERHAPGIRASIVAAQAITPLQLHREYGFAGGHIFHGELALDQLFTMRPLLGYARYQTPFRGLFLCGAGTHPGGFMTGASGRLAAQAALSTREI